MARTIRSLVKNLAGVHIMSEKKRHKTGFEIAMDDIKAGNVEEFSSVDALMKDLLD